MNTHWYIAGPMRGVDGFNFPLFYEAEKVLRFRLDDYSTIFNPARNDIDEYELDHDDPLTSGRDLQDMDMKFDLRKALGADMEYITSTCTDMLLLPGWQDSSGARAEVAMAEALGIRLWEYTPQGVVQYIEEKPAPCVPGEVRAVSATGGEKGTKLARYDLIPAGPLCRLAEHFGRGAKKYEDNNWRRGYPWSLSYAALMRHLEAWRNGEDIDEETGSKHLTAVAWHAFALDEFTEHFPEYDDRFTYSR